MLPFVYVAIALAVLFGASLLVERLLRRSRKEFKKPGWFFVFYGAFIPACAAVYALIEIDSPYLYAAYGAAGGVAALLAQCFYGIKLSESAQ